MTITIRLSNAAFDELHHSEYGAYEDALPGDGGPAEARFGSTHLVDILDRQTRGKTATTVKLLDDGEAAEMYYSVCSGTFALEYKGFLRTAQRIAELTREAARRYDPDLVIRFPSADGY